MHRLHHLLVVSLICLAGCTAVPTGVTPKPDIRPVQQSVAKAQTSVSNARADISKLKQSQDKADAALQQATANLDKYTGADAAITAAKAELATVREQFAQAVQYRDWADTELSNAWKYEEDAKSQIVALGAQIDTAHTNEQNAVKAAQEYKGVYDEVNRYWGLGAFGYGVKELMKHLLWVLLALGVGGVLLFFLAPAAIPVIIAIFWKIVAAIKNLFGIFRKK